MRGWGAVSHWSPSYGTMELPTVNRFSLCPTTISSCLGDQRPSLSLLMHYVLLMSCLTLLRCCLCKCTVGKCAYSSAFVYNSLARLSVDVLRRAVSSLSRVLDLQQCYKFPPLSLHKHFISTTYTTVAKVRWKLSAGGHNQQPHMYSFTHGHPIRPPTLNIYRTVS